MLLCADVPLRAADLVDAAPGRQVSVWEPPASNPCRWWSEEECAAMTEGLPPDAPVVDTLITVDAEKSIAYLFRDGQLVAKAPAATGMDKMLVKGSRQWLFRTPRGRVSVQRKIVNPVWTKPDWAFVEEGRKIPPMNSPSRKVPGKMGKYALDLGEGILIHGTDDPKSIGKKVSHGCIRLDDRAMKLFYEHAKVGTIVYIY